MSLVGRIVASRAAAGPRTPDDRREQTSPLTMPWHVRTFILPLSDRPGLVFFNLISGRTRIAGFDDEPAEHDHHLVVTVVDGARRRCGTLTAARPPEVNEGELVMAHDDWEYRVGGAWPRYRHTLRAPGWGLRADVSTTCEEPLHWWSQTHPLYSHYSAFGRASGEVSVGGVREDVGGWTSVEHGCGGNLRRVPGRPRIPTALFHYQLGALDSGHLFALGRYESMGLEFFHRGVLVAPDGGRTELGPWRLRDTTCETIDDRCGGTMEVPVGYGLQIAGEGVELDYRAEAMAPTLAGRGRLTSGAASLHGALTVGGQRHTVTGSVYVEHLYRTGGAALPSG